MRDLHGQPDGSHTHLWAVPSTLWHTVRDVAPAPKHPVLSSSLLGWNPAWALLMGTNRTSVLELPQTQPEQHDGTTGTCRSQGPIRASLLMMIKAPVWGSGLTEVPGFPQTHISAHPGPSPPTWQQDRPSQASAEAQQGPALASTGLCTPRGCESICSHGFTAPAHSCIRRETPWGFSNAWDAEMDKT